VALGVWLVAGTVFSFLLLLCHLLSFCDLYCWLRLRPALLVLVLVLMLVRLRLRFCVQLQLRM
jgi:hypothetical protein